MENKIKEVLCFKCGKQNTEWKSGVTYHGLDQHHNPPQYMFKKRIYNGKYLNDGTENEKWTGELYYLCRECHTGKNGLHSTIILPHLLKNSSSLRRYENEYWIWCYKIMPSDSTRIRNEIFELTKQWLKKEDDTETTQQS